MKIVMVGYRAAGKTTVGKRIAASMNWPYRDVDRAIEERVGQTLAAYYEKVGEGPYRQIETQVVEELCAEDHSVVSFGAGSLIAQRNQKMACLNALVVYLEVPVAELWRRIESDPQSCANRPRLSLGGVAEVAQMLKFREGAYRECADIVLDGTEGPGNLAKSIISAYRAGVGL